MRNALISTVAFSAPDAVSGASAPAPVVTDAAPAVTTTDAPAKPARKPRAAKPVKPLPTKPVDAAPAPDAEPAVKPLGIARTCATIASNATNFGGVLSDRDNAYIAFYAGFAKRDKRGIVTVRAIADALQATGARPAYAGSAKPHDAGVVNRLRKAGVVAVEADGTSFSFTKHGRTLAVYAAAVA